MKIKTITHIALAIVMAAIVFSVAEVSATWIFADQPPVNREEGLSVELKGFVFTPEEGLPTTQPGQNYWDLYYSILENLKGGLNSSKDVLENAVLNDEDGLLHSGQNVQGGNLKHLFISEACKELDFLIDSVVEKTLKQVRFEDSIDGGRITEYSNK